MIPDFADFFRAIWDHDPFPWQTRLADQVSDSGWPGWITLPTGTGKTASLDIAVYHLACQAALPACERKSPVRIVFAVNRRIVVDEAFERAKKIARRLELALLDPQDILHDTASALSLLSGVPNANPLECYPLRGGTFTDNSWARTPTQPMVITTTLDQLGSRLLFRGYGVSDYARPIHAALLANDTLLILDEAHAAKAFSQTLASIRILRERADEPLRLPFSAVQLTATPPEALEEIPFGLNEDDYCNMIIAKRLGASKPTAILPVVEGAKGKSRHSKMAVTLREKAVEYLASEDAPRRVLIVVNRIATAEALYAQLVKLSKAKKGGHRAAVRLLTGRLRPLDRNALIVNLTHTHHLKAPCPPADTPPLILISTQTIEVGADFDFDTLLTELAPLDSLRQRFGRLNRQGRSIPARAVIVAPDEALSGKSPDPLYGESLPAVWNWLQEVKDENDKIDFGIEAIGPKLPVGEDLTPMLAPAPDAPILLAPHLDLLCQTSPEPHVSPDPALYIHGPGREFPQVSVVLRADLIEGSDRPLFDAVGYLKAVPPLAMEGATVPLHLVRDWLQSPDNLSDNSGDAPEAPPRPNRENPLKIDNAICWRAGEATVIHRLSDLRAGDTLVIPAQTDSKHLAKLLPLKDGLSAWALDQFEPARLLSRDRLAFRLHARSCEELINTIEEEAIRTEARAICDALLARDQEEERWVFRVAAWKEAMPRLAMLIAMGLPTSHPLKDCWAYAAWVGKNPHQPRPSDDWIALPLPSGTHAGVLMVNRTRVGATKWPVEPANLGQQGPQGDGWETLGHHSCAVESRAEANAGILPDGLVRETVKTSGRLHDLGKLDPRFQAMLHGCDLWAVEGFPEKLAKSGQRSPAERNRFSERSGLPKGFRHELLSALLVDYSEHFREHPERDLLLHLIASHHGRCRALAPVVPDKRPEPFDVPIGKEGIRFSGVDCPLAHIESGVARRFWSLNRRFGWWGLPYLETLLRLADQYESANPTKPE